ncbi:hypothetical protein FPRO05_09112 [Fusarium proliferatum]|uniref:Uncharacterized protein n=1 Tax=Gibberella intermedia TaxID=948311 RepID=A0A365NGI9_GIBIN|nr:hypothetical protein FPRO05_09112 [Fusarium proliferatum]
MGLNLHTSDPRYLVKLHEHHRQNPLTAKAFNDEELLAPDEQRFYSVYGPSLTAGQRTITVKQDVVDPEGDNFTLSNSQTFKVVAPRFNLSPSDVHSFYPPSGGTVSLKMLPHIVFKDPHLPWERQMGSSTPPKDGSERTRVPWLALWVFRPDELVSPGTGIFAGKALSSTRATRLKVSEVMQAGTSDICTPYKNNEASPDDEDSQADFICVNKQLFQALCQSYNSDGSSTGEIDLTSYGYLAHVRKVGSEALKAAAASVTNDCFSVVITNRTGSSQNQDSGSLGAVAHLVSLEGIGPSFKPSSDAEPVIICSLFSWTFNYTLQDDQVEFENALRTIGTPTSGLEWLRPSQDRYARLLNAQEVDKQRVGQRIRDGYSLTRYRTISGEETLALQRGVLIPTLPSPNTALNKPIHLFSTQLQILDTEIGLVDNSYAVAWNIGKANALADERFLSALVRLRTTIYKRALLAAKAEVMGSQDEAPAVLERLISATDSLLKLSDAKKDNKLKWFSDVPAETDESLSIWGKEMRGKFAVAVTAEINKLAQAFSSAELYDEQNDPSSSDWAAVIAWVCDALFLANIPWYHLFMEPSSLPPNSVRFFYVDPTWLNAYLDGALSIGNHVEGDQDSVRAAIKLQLQKFFTTKNAKSGYQPQVPISGLLVRSPLVADFEDLGIEAPRRPDDSRATILRRVKLAPDILLVMFDRVLTNDEFPQGIEICQPPHEQSFLAYTGTIENGKIEMAYRNITTKPASSDNVPMTPIDTRVSKPAETIMNSQYGIILAENIAKDVYNFLIHRTNTTFSETAPSSALLALHLSYMLAKLRLTLPEPNPAHVVGDFEIAMLEVQDLRGLGPQYRKREKDTRDNIKMLLHNVTPKLSDDTQESIYPSPRPPYFSMMSRMAPDDRDELGSDSDTQTSAPSLPSESQYALQVYALGYKTFNDPAGAQTRVPHDAKGPLNLVFGIQRRQQAAGTPYTLRRIAIHIPSETNGSINSFLLGYAGPGAYMANNIRYIPEISCPPAANNEAAEVVVNLTPRSKANITTSPKSCLTTLNNDMTFVLRQVSLNVLPQTLNADFAIKMNEYYGDSPMPITSTAQVKLVDTKDL